MEQQPEFYRAFLHMMSILNTVLIPYLKKPQQATEKTAEDIPITQQIIPETLAPFIQSIKRPKKY